MNGSMEVKQSQTRPNYLKLGKKIKDDYINVYYWAKIGQSELKI